MVSLEEITAILQNSPLAFKLAIVIGLILIIIAIAPSLSIPILKVSELTLSKKQSMILGAVGGVLILSGLVGLSQMINEPPIIEDLDIIPQPNDKEPVASESGTPLTVYIKAKDPDSNSIFQNMFSMVTPLQYDFSFKGPATGNRILHARGPDANDTWIWWIYPAYAGNNTIVVNITDRPTGDEDTKYVTYEYVLTIKKPNQPPTIEGVYADCDSPQPINQRIIIGANATDQEKNKVYYRFLRAAPNSIGFSVSQNWSEENEMFWMPNEGDIGNNIIRVQVRDGHHDQKDDSKDLRFEIIDSPSFNSTSNSSGGSA